MQIQSITSQISKISPISLKNHKFEFVSVNIRLSIFQKMMNYLLATVKILHFTVDSRRPDTIPKRLVLYTYIYIFIFIYTHTQKHDVWYKSGTELNFNKTIHITNNRWSYAAKILEQRSEKKTTENPRNEKWRVIVPNQRRRVWRSEI